jgi:hypothetical protein
MGAPALIGITFCSVDAHGRPDEIEAVSVCLLKGRGYSKVEMMSIEKYVAAG